MDVLIKTSIKELASRRLASLILAICLLATFTTACARNEDNVSTSTRVQIILEDGGTILLELDAQVAPVTVANFIKLADSGFYDGLTFHRVIPGFMIQGGDPKGDGTGGSTETIIGEFKANSDYDKDNSISHTRGVISMARSNDFNSARSQFFITNSDAKYLDGKYAAFGKVLEGMDVVDRISAVETDSNDKPLVPVVIKSIRSI